ncbi:hypothetical protein ACU686_23665 [Yinghuangia aomiensis]
MLDEDFVKEPRRSPRDPRGLACSRRSGGRTRAGAGRVPGGRGHPATSRFRRTRQRDAWGRRPRRDRTNLKIAVWFVLLALLLLIASNQGLLPRPARRVERRRQP